MASTKKDPEERRNDIIHAAKKVFLEEGYDKTLVSQIVMSLGLAQGTFYYYFKSKEHILIEILQKAWDSFAAEIDKKLSNTGLCTLEKLNLLLKMIFMPDKEMIDGHYFRLLHDHGIRSKFNQVINDIRVTKLKPVFSEIVYTGIKNGTFKEIRHVEDITEILLYGISKFMNGNSYPLADEQIYRSKMESLGELFEKILGVEKGSICIVKEEKNV